MFKEKDRIKMRERKKRRKLLMKLLCRQIVKTNSKQTNVMTVEALFKWVENFNIQDAQTISESTEEYIKRLLNKYSTSLKDVQDYSCTNDVWLKLLNDVNELNGVIINSLELYAQAKIADSIDKFHNLLRNDSNLLILEINPTNVEDKNWYRMRMQDVEEEKRVFPANEMFHVPFNLRHKVSLARYSISGYPCLYFSRSVWATWEEMHEPQLSDFTVSRLELQNPFAVLDLRVPVWNGYTDDWKLVKQLYTIPLVLACSVKVQYPKGNFKPEYIIPQLIMLAIAYNDVPYMGCSYTSTRRNPRFTWHNLRLLDNIALPVKMVSMKHNLCPKLCSLFKVTDSTNYDYELLKEPYVNLFWNYVNGELSINGAKCYENSIFGQIERRLLEIESKPLF